MSHLTKDEVSALLVRYDGFLLFTVGDPNNVLFSRIKKYPVKAGQNAYFVPIFNNLLDIHHIKI